MEKSSPIEGESLIQQVQTKGMAAVEAVYQNYRADFLAFVAKYGASEADNLDVWQDTVIAFYENVVEGKLTQFTSSPKTYLFSIGKYILLNKLKKQQRFDSGEVGEVNTELADNQIFEDITLTHQQQTMAQALNQLGGQCRELLLLFYYRRYDIKSIQAAMNYTSENTVKASKSRCMKNLKTILEKMDIF